MKMLRTFALYLTGFIIGAASIDGGIATNQNSGFQSEDLQAVINEASAGDTLILSGTFDGTFNNNSLTLSFQGEKKNKPAILDGKFGSSVFTVTGSSVLVSFSDLIFQNGSANEYGGGINNILSNTVSLNRCQLINNYAPNYGGGICSYGPLNINETVIKNNTSEYGGAIYQNTSAVLITNSKITNNTGLSYGGGCYATDCEINFTNSKINKNSTPYTGGGLYLNQVTANIVSSQINKNSAYEGGGIYQYSNDEASPSQTTIVKSEVNGNSATIYGGGIYNQGNYASLTIDRTNVINNTAYYTGGGIVNTGSGELQIINQTKIKDNYPNNFIGY